MKILLIINYLGELPPWIHHFLQSCKFNPKINWVFFTDQVDLPKAPDNIKFVNQSLTDFEVRVKQKLELTPKIEFPRKLCDFRPTYGVLFDDYISGYDFWGHCDIDVIFGDLTQFLSDDALSSHEVISSRMQMHMSGHLSIYRNNELLNNAYKRHVEHKRILTSSAHAAFDESERQNEQPGGITRVLREMALAGEINPLWLNNSVSYPHQIAKMRMEEYGKHPGNLSSDDFWTWINGKIFYKGNVELPIAYLHFKGWKDEPEFNLHISTISESFRIDASGIHNIYST